jgi:hypothetical protein
VLYDADGDYETTDDQIVGEGTLRFTLGIDFKLKIEWFKLKQIGFVKTIDETAEINLIAGIKKSWEKEIELGKIYFSPIPVGPVVLVPEATIVIGANAEVGLKVTTGITQTAKIQAGLEYNDGTWTTIKDFSTNFQFHPPSLTTEGDIKGYAGPKLALKIYGVTGPYADVDGYLQLTAQLTPKNYWELYGGIEGKGGVEFTILSFVKASYEATLIDYKIPIASGTFSTNRSPTISSLTANPTSVSPGAVSTITCTASDPDGDTLSHTWSATGGAISGSGSSVSWTAPSTTGTYTITCTVSDGKGGSDTKNVNIIVTVAGGGVKFWTRQLGTNTTDYGWGVATDSSGNIYVTGATYGGLDGNTNAGYWDIFLIKFGY